MIFGPMNLKTFVILPYVRSLVADEALERSGKRGFGSCADAGTTRVLHGEVLRLRYTPLRMTGLFRMSGLSVD